MNGISIGTLSRTVGLASSAIRYYERAGLLAKPARQSGQRRYAAAAIGRLRIIKVAREAGFTISETKTFLCGFSETTPPAARWRSLAQRKLEDLSTAMVRIQRMKEVLETSFRCGCLRIEDCERAIVGARELAATAAKAK
jgi:MerR family redox-sensitive transcriptional activator SoxR